VSINKFHDRWRLLIGECEHPDLTIAGKLILLRLVDYTNSKDFTAWPSFNTLADDLRLNRSTVIRAVNAGRKVGLLKRTRQGGKTRRGGTSNRYTFDPRYDPDLVAGAPPGQDERPSGRGAINLVAGVHRPSGRRATQSSDLSSKGSSEPAPPSSSVEPSAVVADKKRPKRTPEELTAEMATLDAQMAAAGVDMSRSRRRNGAAVKGLTEQEQASWTEPKPIGPATESLVRNINSKLKH
jgi:hypothetical protein